MNKRLAAELVVTTIFATIIYILYQKNSIMFDAFNTNIKNNALNLQKAEKLVSDICSIHKYQDIFTADLLKKFKKINFIQDDIGEIYAELNNLQSNNNAFLEKTLFVVDDINGTAIQASNRITELQNKHSAETARFAKDLLYKVKQSNVDLINPNI